MKDTEVFKGTYLTDLLKDSYNLHSQRRTKINNFITLLMGMIQKSDDVVMLGPILKDFFDILIKSDETLIKVATVVQRISSAESYSNKESGTEIFSILSDEEKAQLMANLQEIKEVNTALDTKVISASSSVSTILPDIKIDDKKNSE